jgi:MFS family permease
MINLRQFITEGISIKADELIGLYIPGIALSIWLYVFALGEVYSNYVLKFGVPSRTIYVTLLVSIILASIVTGGLIDKMGKSPLFTYTGLGVCGIISLLSFIITSSTLLIIYSLLVGSGIGIGITGLRVYLTDLTETEERGRIAGGLLFLSYIAIAIIFSRAVLKQASLTNSIIFVSLICIAGFTFYFKVPKLVSSQKKISAYGKTLQYFFISWLLFALAYGTWNAMVTPHPISLISSIDSSILGGLILLGYALAAITGGVSIDWMGRRFVIGFALAILAIGYMLYAFVPMLKNHKGLFFGLALGVFFGGFLLGESVANLLGPLPRNYVSLVSSAMLVLAIVPLIKSDEPLAKEKVKVREMASYMKDLKGLKP